MIQLNKNVCLRHYFYKFDALCNPNPNKQPMNIFTTIGLVLLFFAAPLVAQHTYVPTVTTGYVVFETPFVKVDKTAKNIAVKPIGAYNFALPFYTSTKNFSVAFDFTFVSQTESGSIGFDLFLEGGAKLTYLISEKGRLKAFKNEGYAAADTELTGWDENVNVKKGVLASNRLEIKITPSSAEFYVNTVKWFSTAIVGANLGYISIQNSKIIKHFTINNIEFSTKPLLRKVQLPKQITNYESVAFGAEVNNANFHQVTPLFSADEKILFFTRKEQLDRVYQSKLTNSKQWSQAQLMGAAINPVGFNKSIISTNTDGSVLFIKGALKDGRNYEGGITRLEKQKNGDWGNPEFRYIDNYMNYDEHRSNYLSTDERYLLQCLNTKKGFGDLDVHVSIIKPNGHYGEPINLGPIINSAGNESYAFLAPDNVTLYFSSKGLPGYGSNDIYMSKRLDETWQKWSTPVNLGPKINTSKWDGYFSTSASGKTGLLSSSNDRVNSAIFSVQLPLELRPNPVVLVTGFCFKDSANVAIEAAVSFKRLRDSVVVTVSSNPETGLFSFVLLPGEKYEILAQKSGFYPISDFLDLSKLTTYQEMSRDLYLVPIKNGGVFRLNNLFFESGKHQLLKDSYSELDRLVRFLNEKPTLTIEISGHTDATGDAQLNQQLSENRAKSVKDYLVSKGISETRLVAKGYGKLRPIAPNTTEVGKAKNRRVEFVIAE